MLINKKLLLSAAACGLLSGASLADSNAGQMAASAFSQAAKAIDTMVASSFSYFDDLYFAVKAIDPNGSVRLKSNGTYAITLFGNTYIVMPDTQMTGGGGATTPHFEVVNGVIYFVDHTNAKQIFHLV